MTTGILGALLLKAQLEDEWNSAPGPAGFAKRVQQRMVDVVAPAWNLATSEDLRLDSTIGGRLRTRDRLMQYYFDRVVAAATSDPGVRRRLLAVMNMVDGPQVLLRPAVIGAVIRHQCGFNRPAAPLWVETTSPGRDEPGAPRRAVA